LRRSLPTIWAQIPVSERSRIVRRLRVYWDVHRYRLAPQVAATLDDALRIGQLEVSAGRIHRIEATAGGFDVIWQARGQAHASREAFDAIINCTGPDADVGRSSNALFRNLLAYGLVRPDPLRLGLDVDAESRALDGEGRPVPGLYVTGPLTRGRFGEVMGVPDASKHARWVADRIATEIAK
jgi:uncharacterized NAD(P)/FAD-binding protein YdhS